MRSNSVNTAAVRGSGIVAVCTLTGHDVQLFRTGYDVHLFIQDGPRRPPFLYRTGHDVHHFYIARATTSKFVIKDGPSRPLSLHKTDYDVLFF